MYISNSWNLYIREQDNLVEKELLNEGKNILELILNLSIK
jgi:hypothetical protein